MPSPEEMFTKTIAVAAKLPGVRIDREKYLRATLSRSCSTEQVDKAIAEGLAKANVDADTIDAAARAAINIEAAKVSALSTAAGVPGGFSIIATIPADGAQYFAHMMRISQKLAYIYDWPDLMDGDAEDIDDETLGVLVLFIGVMFGTQAANGAVTKLAAGVAGNLAKQIPQQAVTKGVLYPVVRKVAKQVGVRMTVPLFAGGVAKVVPIVGGIVNGGLTLATFMPMSHRLRRHLSESSIATSEAAESSDE